MKKNSDESLTNDKKILSIKPVLSQFTKSIAKHMPVKKCLLESQDCTDHFLLNNFLFNVTLILDTKKHNLLGYTTSLFMSSKATGDDIGLIHTTENNAFDNSN